MGVSVEMFLKEVWKKEFDEEITDVGVGIKGNIIKKIFNHKKGVPVKSAKYEKSKLYEKMLPTVVLVVVLVDG